MTSIFSIYSFVLALAIWQEFKNSRQAPEANAK
jgi:hypothetical protein